MPELDKPIKKTVAIHPFMDAYIRETWAILVKDQQVRDATYSAALNFMLLAAVMEANKKRGWTKETRDSVWSLARDQSMSEQLKVHEALTQFREYIERQEFKGK